MLCHSGVFFAATDEEPERRSPLLRPCWTDIMLHYMQMEEKLPDARRDEKRFVLKLRSRRLRNFSVNGSAASPNEVWGTLTSRKDAATAIMEAGGPRICWLP